MDFQEIIKELEEQGVTTRDFVNADIEKSPEKIGPWKIVDSYGGSGKGEDYYKVFHFTDHDVYIRIDGFYSSYEGVEVESNFESCCEEVKPVTKTVTVFE